MGAMVFQKTSVNHTSLKQLEPYEESPYLSGFRETLGKSTLENRLKNDPGRFAEETSQVLRAFLQISPEVKSPKAILGRDLSGFDQEISHPQIRPTWPDA